MNEQRIQLRTELDVQRATASMARVKGHGFEAVIRPHSPPRSNQQNARYWAILNDIAGQAKVEGKLYSAETWHVYFRLKFLPTRTLFGQVVPLSTTKLSKTKFANYCNMVEADAASELGVRFDYREAG